VAEAEWRSSAAKADAAWQRVDRTLDGVRARLGDAETQEQFQAIGLLCRDVLISVAQAVYDPPDIRVSII
jgi:hypothetical protein